MRGVIVIKIPEVQDLNPKRNLFKLNPLPNPYLLPNPHSKPNLKFSSKHHLGS